MIPDLFKSKHMYFCVENNSLFLFYLLASVFKFVLNSHLCPYSISCLRTGKIRNRRYIVVIEISLLLRNGNYNRMFLEDLYGLFVTILQY
jgi:hypothetical protein